MLRTVRYLRPAQVVARASFVLERAVAGAPGASGILDRRYARQWAAIAASTADGPPLWRWPPAPLDPAARAEPGRAADISAGRFTFLNQPLLLPDPVDWSAPGMSRLWRFQLHSFDYAVDLAVAARRRDARAYDRLRCLVRSWLHDHPVSADDAWHPFVASARLIAWLVARDLLAGTLQSDPAFAEQLRRAVLTHALFVDEHLETDVGGNHLLKNLVALLLAGCAFDGPQPERWRARSARLLHQQLARQILADGGHYERSPMYHGLVLADLLVALFPAGRRDLPVAVPLADAVRRMQRYALTLVHPDGDIPLFNDAALGAAPAPARLVGPSTEPLGGGALAPSGYFLMPVAPGACLVADCGPPGPDDLPAHVHADALALEVSVGGRRLLVDGGVAGYERGQLRDYLRGTAAHNTVQVDGQDQSEVWGSFRVGHRARVRLGQWSADGQVRTLVGHHDGYAHLGVRHERRIDAVNGVGWRVIDALYGRGQHTAVTRLRLHPDFGWRPGDGGDGDDYVAVDADGAPALRVRPVGRVTVSRERGLYAERFGQVQEVAVLCLTWAGDAPLLSGCWLLLPGGEPIVV